MFLAEELTFQMEAVFSSETLVPVYQPTEQCHMDFHHRESLNCFTPLLQTLQPYFVSIYVDYFTVLCANNY
jgi:hypothetical protein